jgi:tetrahydromethanopterin S-methyltransferase subunit G
MSKAQKLQDTGDKMTRIGKQITGIVYGTAFMLILLFILFELAKAYG